MTVLIVAAHPDDEVLGCGGTIARLGAGGHEVSVQILAQGVMARPGSTDKELIELREASRRALASLGVSDVVFHDFPDNRMDSVAMLDLVQSIEATLSRVQPHTVFTHHVGDLNVDHRLTAQAVITATRPMPGESVGSIYSWENASSTEWSFGHTSPFEPNTYIDISPFLGTKESALAEYGSELRTFPHARSLESLRAKARVRGSEAGFEAAEAFVLLRALRGNGDPL